MEVTDRPPTRFSVVLPSEIRDQIRHQARSLGTHESVVVKLALRAYLAPVRPDPLVECSEQAAGGRTTRHRPD